jgi:hypothetical protein
VALDISFLKKPKSSLCRVPVSRHSAKTSLPSACLWTLGKDHFAECQIRGTRQSNFFLIFKKSLPSARSRALGKEVKQQPLLLLHSLSLAHFSLTATPERHCQHPAAPALLPATPQRRGPLPPPRRPRSPRHPRPRTPPASLPATPESGRRNPRSPRHLASCPSPARLCRVSAG